MNARQQRRFDTLRAKLEGHVEVDRAPDRPILTVTAVRAVSPHGVVIDFIDHTTSGEPVDRDEIDLDDFPDEDDDFLADMYLQNLIEDLLAAD